MLHYTLSLKIGRTAPLSAAFRALHNGVRNYIFRSYVRRMYSYITPAAKASLRNFKTGAIAVFCILDKNAILLYYVS